MKFKKHIHVFMEEIHHQNLQFYNRTIIELLRFFLNPGWLEISFKVNFIKKNYCRILQLDIPCRTFSSRIIFADGFFDDLVLVKFH